MTEVTPSLENSRFQAFFKITVLRSPARWEGGCFLALVLVLVLILILLVAIFVLVLVAVLILLIHGFPPILSV